MKSRRLQGFLNDFCFIFLKLRQEKVQLEHTLEQEQECLVNKLMRRIDKLETETNTKQSNLETLRRFVQKHLSSCVQQW